MKTPRKRARGRLAPRLTVIDGNPEAPERAREQEDLDRGVWRARYTTAAGDTILYAIDSRGRQLAAIPLEGLSGGEERVHDALSKLLNAVDPVRPKMELVR